MYYLTKTAYAHGDILTVASALEDAYTSIEMVSTRLKEVCGENLFTGLNEVSIAVLQSLSKGFKTAIDDLIRIDSNVKSILFKSRASANDNAGKDVVLDNTISHAIEVVMFWSERLPFKDEMANFIYIMNRTVDDDVVVQEVVQELDELRQFSCTYYAAIKRALSTISLAKFDLHPTGIKSYKGDESDEKLIEQINNVWETNTLDSVSSSYNINEDDEDDEDD